MLYNYNDELYHSDKLEITVRGKTMEVDFFDGMRIDPDSIPQGKHMYHTRHGDNNDWATPVMIQVEGRGVMVNFCGTVVSDEPIGIDEETFIDDVNWL